MHHRTRRIGVATVLTCTALLSLAPGAIASVIAGAICGPIESSESGGFLDFSASAQASYTFATPGFSGPNSFNYLGGRAVARAVHGGMRAFANASSTGSHSFAGISATGTAGFTDILNISTPLPLTQGAFVALVWVSGSVSDSGPASAIASASIGVTSVLGTDTVSVSLDESNPATSGYRLIQIPIDFGENFQIQGNCSVSATAGSDFLLGGGAASADFASTMYWGGIVSVVDAQGAEIGDWSVSSSSGADYRDEILPPPIPAPSGAWLAIAGFMFRRRR